MAVGQMDAGLSGGLHPEAVHDLTGLGNIDPVVVIAAHFDSLLFQLPESKALSGGRLAGFSF